MRTVTSKKNRIPRFRRNKDLSEIPEEVDAGYESKEEEKNASDGASSGGDDKSNQIIKIKTK